MTDYSELKRLAEAATPGPWSTEANELYWLEDGYTKHLMETFDGSDICHDAEHPANLKFIAAANPAAVLALIADVEALLESEQESTELCDTLSVLLGHVAVAVRGPEEPNSRHGFHDLPSRVKTVVGERDQLKAEVEALRGVMAAVVSEIPHARYVSPGNSPGHSHRRPGIWDEDNGAKAGKECGWCKVWNTAIAMSKESGHD